MMQWLLVKIAYKLMPKTMLDGQYNFNIRLLLLPMHQIQLLGPWPNALSNHIACTPQVSFLEVSLHSSIKSMTTTHLDEVRVVWWVKHGIVWVQCITESQYLLVSVHSPSHLVQYTNMVSGLEELLDLMTQTFMLGDMCYPTNNPFNSPKVIICHMWSFIMKVYYDE